MSSGYAAAGCLAFLAALLFYLGAKHQQLRPALAGSRAIRRLAGLSLAAALAFLATTHGSATRLYVLATLLMLVWSILPLGVAYWRHSRKPS